MANYVFSMCDVIDDIAVVMRRPDWGYIADCSNVPRWRLMEGVVEWLYEKIRSTFLFPDQEGHLRTRFFTALGYTESNIPSSEIYRYIEVILVRWYEEFIDPLREKISQSVLNIAYRQETICLELNTTFTVPVPKARTHHL